MIVAIIAAAALSQGAVEEVVVTGRLLKPDQPHESSIQVTGTGKVERTADFAAVTGSVEAEAADQQAALKAMSAQRDAVEASLTRLAEAKSVKIETDEIAFSTIRPAGCEETESQPLSNKGRCAPIAVRASLKLTATVWPAEKVGSAASLAVQLGLKSVDLGESGVNDDNALQAEALRAAYADAKSQAELLAQASGRHLGSLTSITRFNASALGDDRLGGYAHVPAKEKRGPEPSLAPDVALKLTTPKVVRQSIISAEFALDK